MSNLVRFDCYQVDLSAGQLYKRGTRVSLRDKSFQVLAALLEHPGEVVTREELQRRLWQREVFVDFDNNLNTAIARLREVLGDCADRPRFIETLPKHGYRFLAGVSVQAKAPQEVTVHTPRLLVLPFLNLCGDPAQEYFSDAMTDEVITALAAIAPEQLAVIARTTAMHYKGSHKDVARIGAELSVDYLVEGGVYRHQDQVEINLQLIQVSNQVHLFAKKYRASLADVFNLRYRVAEEVAAHLDHRKVPSPPAAARKSQKMPRDPAAYDAYIRGRSYSYQWTPAGIATAKEFLEQALARDPEFALAYDALAETCWWTGFLGIIRPRDAFSAGVFAALRALELDNSLAETHALLGVFRKELDYNWPEVQREMALALRLDPASPVVRFRYAGSGLLPHGRIDESVAELERALQSDPLSLFMHVWLGEVLYLGGRYGQAIEQCRLTIRLDPSYFLSYFELGQVGCEQGEFDAAIANLRQAAALSGNAPLVLGWLGMTLARSGDDAGARQLLAGLQAAASQAYVLPTSFAWIYLGLGEIDQAFACMERAVEERDPIIIPIKTYPFLDPLRSDPRFLALLRRMHLDGV